jgi:large subunit ribosomal protein L3
MIGHFKKANVPPKRVVKEFPVTADAHVPVGASLDHVLTQSLRGFKSV